MVQDFMNQPELTNRLKNLIGQGMERRFGVNIDQVRNFNPILAKYLVKDPIQALKMFQDSLNQTVKDLSSQNKGGTNAEKQALIDQSNSNFPTKTKVYYVNFEGNLGRNHVTPRGLKSSLVNQYVGVNGIVTRMTIVKPKIQTSVHYCEETKRGLVKNYND